MNAIDPAPAAAMSATSATPGGEARAPRDWFGHPRALPFLFATEMWERFSYYGMRSLLVLYMVKYLFAPHHAGAVIGLSGLRSALEVVFGPLGPQPLASQIYGFYTGLVYLTPIAGGLLADRAARAAAHRHSRRGADGGRPFHDGVRAAAPVCARAARSSATAPSSRTSRPRSARSTRPGDRRRDRAFSIFYVGINLGAFLAPLICGTLGEDYGWHYGFAAAGVGMTLGLVIYLAATPLLPPEAIAKRETAPVPLGKADWRSILALVALMLPVSLFWATYEQQGNTIPLWADQQTDRAVDLLFYAGNIPVTWFQAFNPFMIFAFTPFVVALWRWQGHREPTTVTKMAIGCFFNAGAWLVMLAAAWSTGEAKASWLWLLAFFAVMTIGELYLSPTSLSLVTKIAPASLLSMLMGVWLSTSFIGGFLAGYLGTFWSSMTHPTFFLLLAAISAAAGLAIAVLNRPLRAALSD